MDKTPKPSSSATVGSDPPQRSGLPEASFDVSREQLTGIKAQFNKPSDVVSLAGGSDPLGADGSSNTADWQNNTPGTAPKRKGSN